jgi:protein-tyrosine-phosphatase
MREIGIDISGHRSKHVDEFNGQRFDYVITVCDNAKESCPVFMGTVKQLHHSFEDPRRPRKDPKRTDLPYSGGCVSNYAYILKSLLRGSRICLDFKMLLPFLASSISPARC